MVIETVAPLLLGLDWLDPEQLLDRFGDYALWGAAAIVFAECGLLIGFFLPGDSLLFTVGLLAAQDKISYPLWLCCLVLFVASLAGNALAGHAIQQQRNKTWAVFASGDFDVTDAFKLRGGVRYTKDEKEFSASILEPAPFGAPAGGPDDLLANESRKVTEALAREAIANFADARQSFVAFVETNWDHAELAEVPRLLGEVAGALQMLDLPQPAHYLAGVRAYTERELIARGRVPSSRQLDTIADALASLEYYLEALREQRPNRDDILDVARNSLEALDYWPVPELADEPVQAPPAATAPAVSSPAPSSGSDDPDAAAVHLLAGLDAGMPAPVPGTVAGPPAAFDAPAPGLELDIGVVCIFDNLIFHGDHPFGIAD